MTTATKMDLETEIQITLQAILKTMTAAKKNPPSLDWKRGVLFVTQEINKTLAENRKW